MNTRPVIDARSPGMSLVELIVAMTVLSIGVLGLAGAALLGQRTFATAAAVERAVGAASVVLDSLMHVPAPTAGAIAMAGADVDWSVAAEDPRAITLNVHVVDGVRRRTLTFHAVHSERLVH